MRQEVMSTQRMPRIEAYRIVEASVTGSATSSTTVMPEGYSRGTILEEADNVYTLAFTEAFSRVPVVTITPLHSTTGTSIIVKIKSVTTSAVVFNTEDAAGAAAAPEGFHIIALGFDVSDQL
jgi:hypothetical protein